MNCKPGDLCITVRAIRPENLGTLVVVVEVDIQASRVFGSTAWIVDGPGIGDLALDDWLRPIRDNDGEDETLTWAGKPSDIKEPSHA